MLGWHLPIHYRHLPRRVEGLGPLFASAVARRVATTFLVFFSIYIFGITEAAGLPTRIGLGVTMGFVVLFFAFKALTLPLAELVGDRYGFRGSIFFSSIAFLPFIPLFVLSSDQPLLLVPSAILWGASAGFFWWGYHGFFVKEGELGAYGRELGTANIVDTAAMVVAPLLAAGIISLFGFSGLFWAAGGVMLLSFLFLVPGQDPKPQRRVRTRQVFRSLFKHKAAALAYIGNAGEYAVQGNIWPLFLFLTLGTTLGVGGVLSAAVLLGAVLTYFVGAFIDKKGEPGEEQMIKVASPFVFLTYLARPLFTSAGWFALVDALYRFFDKAVAIPLDALSYQKAREGGVDRALLFREIAVVLGQLFSSALVTIWLFLGGSLAATFVFGALFALLPFMAVRKGI